MKPIFGIKRLAAIALLSMSSLAQAHGDAHPQDQPLRPEQTAWGIAAPAQAATRTLNFSMNDQMRFSPQKVEVKQGETLRLRIRNEGAVMHEFVLGNKAQLDAHAAMMLKHPGMAHDEPYMAHVAPGHTGEIVWTFNRAGEFDFACLIAGHYQAGMVGKVIVKAQTKKHSH
ncbi:putative cupredoxin-like copper-binding protein [Paucibacter oligotrophus]|uniref:Putative cupredoxin-like copper-binding protein n=1 Tax=Roseateles oligotrophus TaxID=1769250 RepID=A0A840L8G7_9BURK|nr:cupredoxin family protein [Roseateles oligotrophus]MBB4844470.1 putative cupredoxin-like copper-binding protein [Roseateles oligotrophus]